MGSRIICLFPCQGISNLTIVVLKLKLANSIENLGISLAVPYNVTKYCRGR